MNHSLARLAQVHGGASSFYNFANGSCPAPDPEPKRSEWFSGTGTWAILKNMLTKTDFMKYLKCPVYLWLTKHRPDLLPEDTPEKRRTFEMGREVDDFSRNCFPGGVIVEGFNKEGWQNTQKLMQSPVNTLFQPTVVADPLTCRADILTRNNTMSGWDLNEVKMATTVKKEYPYDVAFQRICFENSGISIGRTNVIHINNRYVRHGPLEPDKLFISEDITDMVQTLTPEVKALIPKAISVVISNQIPDAELIPLCPHPKKCEYLKIYLHSIGQEQDTEKIEAITDALAIHEELKKLQYPLYFFDYETYSSAIPPFDGTRPYQQIPFQYSLLIKESPTAALDHKEFLARTFTNPVPALLTQLKQDIGSRGSIIVWNARFEKGRNDEMATMEPAYARFLNSVNGRMYDLMLIFKFKRQWYVKSEFEKSASLKKVLPVMCPEISYAGLSIKDGAEASASWPILTDGNIPESQKAQLAKNMLEYCKRDTEAMVCILERLEKEVNK